jgi:hypothetical protein
MKITPTSYEKNITNHVNNSSYKENNKYNLPLNYDSFNSFNANNANSHSNHFNNNNNSDEIQNKEIEEFVENLLRNSDKIDESIYQRLKGMFCHIITTQNGSRSLQKVIKKTNKDILSLILKEIIDKLDDLIVDSYANYFTQKFFGALKSSDRLKFLSQLGINLVEISKSKIGTYPIQAFIEQLVTHDEKKIIIEAMKEHILDLCYDVQGVHVIEKIIICFEEEMIEFIYEMIINNFMSLANNCNGLCVVKKIIIHSHKEETIERVLKKILDNCLALVQNPFGNYAIQVALDVNYYIIIFFYRAGQINTFFQLSKCLIIN